MTHGSTPTVKIASTNADHVGGFYELNASEYDPTNPEHKLFSESDAAAYVKFQKQRAKDATKNGTGKIPTVALHAGLLGSNDFPASVPLAKGKSIPLGDLVRNAQVKSGLTVPQWNGLNQDARDTLLTSQIEIEGAW